MLLYSLKLGNLPEAMKCLKALIADVPYSNKKLASMDMEERYRLILSTIFNAIGCRVEVDNSSAPAAGARMFSISVGGSTTAIEQLETTADSKAGCRKVPALKE